MPITPPEVPNGSDLVRSFLPTSPFTTAVGIELEGIEDGRASLRMAYNRSRTTYADIVHGGAIATLVDVAIMATAWAGAPVPGTLRGVTVSMSMEFVDAAKAEDLVAEGRLIRRGRTLASVEVDVRGADQRMIAKAIGTYKMG